MTPPGRDIPPVAGGSPLAASPAPATAHVEFGEWDRVVKVTCHGNCSYQRSCVLNAFVRDGAVVKVEQAANYPLPNDSSCPDWSPRGCQKGLAYAHHMYDPTRVLYPLKRVGPRGSGQWQRVSWGEALTDVADSVIDVISTEGHDAISYLGGTQSLGSEGISIQALMTALGVPQVANIGDVGDFHNGAAQVFGQCVVGSSADNWYYADLILIWGGNPSYTNIVNYHYITEARYHGTKVTTISADYSPSAVHADRWLTVNIGTDAALALSVAQVMIREKLYKADFLREQTDLPLLVRMDTKRYLREKDLKRGGREDAFYFWDSRTSKLADVPRKSLHLGEAVPALEGEFEVATLQGKFKVKPVFQLLKERLDAHYTPEQASRVTGTSSRAIEELARDVGRAKGVVNISTFNWGKFYHGDLIERAIVLVFALGGHMGRKGATYNAFMQLATDATISGIGVRGNVFMRAAAAGDPRFAQWRVNDYTDEMIMLEYAKEAFDKGYMIASSFFMFVHGGLLELSQQHNSWDPSLKRPLSEYVREALAKGWQGMVPPPGKAPRIIFNAGGSFIRRVRGTETLLRTLLPKLRLLVNIDFRMGATSLYADYVLPSCAWWEKHSFQGLQHPELPLAFLTTKAVEPLHESKTEWEIGCLLAKKVQERAIARGVLTFTDREGKEQRLDNLYDRVTVNGLYWDTDEESAARDYFANASNLEQIPWEELQERGFTPGTGVGETVRSIGNAGDLVPGEPFIPLTWHIVKKEPYPTLTRRMQFYIDHDWYLELGQELPVQAEDPKVGGDYPLRITGGHTRWSVHSIHIDDALILRLQRGVPLMFMSAHDARARGIRDGDMVEVRNDVASFQIMAAVSPAVKPGQVMIYHAWENYQFPGKHHFKGPMAPPLNPIELVGGYFHIRPTAMCFHPGTKDRETRVEARKV